MGHRNNRDEGGGGGGGGATTTINPLILTISSKSELGTNPNPSQFVMLIDIVMVKIDT